MSAAPYRPFAVAALLSLAADQLTKVWARAALQPIYPQARHVIDGFWDFRYAENRGAAFSFLNGVPGAQFFFMIIAVAITIGTVVYLGRAKLSRPTLVAAGAGLVVGGALGNAYDRLRYGFVTDFIVWKAGSHEWPTFNIADAELVAGIALLFLFLDSKRKADGGAKRTAG